MASSAVWLAGGAVALALLRALVAAMESALAAVGLARAHALAREPAAGRSARALQTLLEGHESTAATLLLLDTLAAMGAALAAAAAAWQAFPGTPLAGWTVGLAASAAVAAAALLSLSLGAAGRALGARGGEAAALALALPLRGLGLILAPVARLVAALARPFALGKARFSLPTAPLDELERELAEYAQSGPAGQSTSELIHRVFEFREKVARDVMVPRTDMVAVDADTPVPELLTLLAERGHSRLPVYRGSLDQVIGTLHVRDLVPLLEHPQLFVLRDLLRPAYFVPWSKPIEMLLREMQRRHLHMAVVVDEFGGVMGLCTLEDVLEEIVGEIGDEFEPDHTRDVEVHADGSYTARGEAPVSAFNHASGAAVPEDAGYETMSGFLNHLAGAIPAAGDRLVWRGWLFTVIEASARRVDRVRATRVKRQAG